VDLSTPGRQQPGEPSVAVAPAGRAVVAWWRRDAALAPRRDVVQIRRRASVTAPFIGPVTLSRRERNSSARPDTAATAGGLVVAGWAEGPRSVALRVLPATGKPIPATTLVEDGVIDLDRIDVGAAPGGSAIAVWTRFAALGRGTIRVSIRSAADGTWSPPRDLSGDGARRPAVALAPNGSAVVAWDRDGNLEAAVGDTSGVFSTPLVLAVGTGARFPAVAVNAAGDAVVTWFAGSVMLAERPAGGAFGPPRAISDEGGLPVNNSLGAPVIAVTDQGRAIAAWRRQIGGAFRVEAAVRPAGSDWGAATVLSPPTPRNAGRRALGTSAAGHAVVSWSQPIGASLSAIRARSLPRSAAAFGRLESVSASNGRGTAPSVGLDATGRAVLAWREDPVGGPGRFFRAAIRFSPG
jgi:hypothetical protein